MLSSALQRAVELIVGVDPQLTEIVALSLGVSGVALLLAALAGIPPVRGWGCGASAGRRGSPRWSTRGWGSRPW